MYPHSLAYMYGQLCNQIRSQVRNWASVSTQARCSEGRQGGKWARRAPALGGGSVETAGAEQPQAAAVACPHQMNLRPTAASLLGGGGAASAACRWLASPSSWSSRPSTAGRHCGSASMGERQADGVVGGSVEARLWCSMGSRQGYGAVPASFSSSRRHFAAAAQHSAHPLWRLQAAQAVQHRQNCTGGGGVGRQ